MSGRQRAASLRKRAKKHFRSLMQRFGGRCAYCRCEVIPVSFIPIENRVKETPHWITAMIDGSSATIRKATIDHATKLEDGGTNYWSNLVLACVACNNGRSKTKREPRNRVCKQCGGPKGAGGMRRRYCISCYRKLVHHFWIKCGVGIS